jgi:hypothetical protein
VPEQFSRGTIGVLVGLAALLAGGILIGSRLVGSAPDATPSASFSTSPPTRTGPVALVPVDAPDAGSPSCAALLRQLPASFTSAGKVMRRAPIAEPAPPAVAAWSTGTSDPVVLRCGLSRPPELVPTSSLTEVSGVRWLPITGDGLATWYTADRAVYVALTIPDATGTGAVQGVSETIASVLAPVGR